MGYGEVNGEAPTMGRLPAAVALKDRLAEGPLALRILLGGAGFALAMMAISMSSHALGTYPFRGWAPMAVVDLSWAAVWTPVYGLWLTRRTHEADPGA